MGEVPFEMSLQVKKKKKKNYQAQFSEEAKTTDTYRQHSEKAKQVKQCVACAPDHEELSVSSLRYELYYPLRTGET